MRPLLDVLRVLHAAEVRAVVVGGVAVVLHGHVRLTATSTWCSTSTTPT